MKKTGLLLVLLFSFGLVWAEEGLPTIKELEWCLDVDFKESACVRFKQALEKACNANNGVACNRLGEVHANNRNGFNLSEVAPYFEKACAARVIEGCLNLGIWYYYSREPVKSKEYIEKACGMDAEYRNDCAKAPYYKWVNQEYFEALELEKACNANNITACRTVGKMYYRGDGVERNLPKAGELYKKACEANDGESCIELGYMYRVDDHNWKADPLKAIEYHKKACNEAKSAKGCYLVGFHYQTIDVLQMAEYYAKACDLKSIDQCLHLAKAYHHGSGGIKKDAVKAVAYYAKACEIDKSSACRQAGRVMYYEIEDRSPGKDHSKSKTFFEKGCDAGDMESCKMLGQIHQFRDDLKAKIIFEKIIAFHGKVCQAGDSIACNREKSIYQQVGRWYYLGDNGTSDIENGKTIYRKNHEKAHEWLGKACDMNYREACHNLGDMYLFDPSIIDRSKAVKYYEKACTVGGFVACHRLGGIYYSKDMNMRDYSKAKEYFEKACNEDYSEACLFLGEMYKNGFGVEKNEAKAKELYETAQKHSDVKVQIHRPPPASAPPSSDSRVRISEGGSLPSARKVKITPEMDMDFKEKALASSMKYNEVACNDGYSAYCHQLGAQYMSTQEYSKAKEYFEKACNMELPKACATLGEMYGNGFGVEKNQDKARKFDEKAQKINK